MFCHLQEHTDACVLRWYGDDVKPPNGEWQITYSSLIMRHSHHDLIGLSIQVHFFISKKHFSRRKMPIM
jgi:hypothetical protein